uniref:Uncharacterized protein n=1 Tax=Arundo donax TaxID=35708 RepID=A0A0A9AGM1_ARUDO
MPPRGQPQRSP